MGVCIASSYHFLDILASQIPYPALKQRQRQRQYINVVKIHENT